MHQVFKLKNIFLKNHDLNIDQNKRDCDFFFPTIQQPYVHVDLFPDPFLVYVQTGP